MEPIQRSKTSAFNNNKTPGEYPEEFLSQVKIIFHSVDSHIAGNINHKFSFISYIRLSLPYNRPQRPRRGVEV